MVEGSSEEECDIDDANNVEEDEGEDEHQPGGSFISGIQGK